MVSQRTLYAFIAVSVVSSALAAPSPDSAPRKVINKNSVTLPLLRHLDLTGTNLLKSDQARAKQLKTQHLTKGGNFNEQTAKNAAGTIGVGVNNSGVSYTVAVTVGDPPQPFTLIVDTGSSNTWVGAGESYVPGNSSVDTGDDVFVSYGSGLFFGEEYIDTISIGDLTIPQQSIGSAELAFGFFGVDGILGLGPVGLTVGTTSSGEAVPTVTDNAFSLGLIDSKVLGVSFEPLTSVNEVNGELTFGGVDTSLFNDPLTVVPITSTFPANQYVGINQTITYNGQEILNSAGIVDTGTTLLLIASDALAAYTDATGAVFNGTVGLYQITPDQLSNLQSLFFTIGDTTFEFTPNAQLWPRAFNTYLGGDPDAIFLIVGDIGSNSGSGLDFINGMSFLERFYTFYDSQNSQFGIATTAFTDATTN